MSPQAQAATLSTHFAEAPSRPSELEDIDLIHALYEPAIFRFLLLSLRDRDAAQSLTQDTFLRAWRSRSSFRADCSVHTWLMRIALNLLRDHTRTDRFRFWKKAAATAVDAADLSTHLPHPNASAESQLIAHQQIAAIWQTVGHLSPRQRTVFLLRFLDELEIPEIAVATGLPVPTVKSHLYRALAVVRSAHALQKDSK